jgi:hypothetical protein
MTAESNDELRPIDAVKAMRARGIDNAEEHLQYATLEQIRGWCEWWDGKQGAGPGLLAKKIREGGDPPGQRPPAGSVHTRLRATHDDYAQRFPPGSVVEPHARLLTRQRYKDDHPLEEARSLEQSGDELCRGLLVVLSNRYPVWEVECDLCGFVAGLPASSLAAVLRRLKVVSA